jgi:hypothetical protein
MWDILPETRFDEMMASIDVTTTSGDGSFGLWLGFSSDPPEPWNSSFYRVAVRTDGSLQIELYEAGQEPELLFETSSFDGTEFQRNVPQRITVLRSGNLLQVALNGVQIGSIRDSRIGEGQIALFAEKDRHSAPLHVTFDNLRIEEPH